MQSERIRQLIEQALPASVRDISGDGVHFEAMIVSDKFTGKNSVQRHQMVYGALGDRMGREIHALSMQTLTPEEWELQGGFMVLNPVDAPRSG